MLNEEVKKYRELSGDNNPHTPISRIGGYLDGYEKAMEQQTGHWIKDDITERSKSAYKHKCDRCGAYHRAMYDYCPSCGAKMEKEKT